MTPAPWRILHLELSEPLPDLEISPPWRKLLVYWQWKGTPLGCREYDVGELPRPAAAVRVDAVQAIAPALGGLLGLPGFEDRTLYRSPARRRAAGADLAALLAVEDPFRALEEELARQAARCRSAGTLSVIVCTRRRPDALAKCLDALEACRGHIDELLVVDNDPADPGTFAVVQGRPWVRYVAETRPGLSRARNAGIRAAKGDLVAFTDDDVEVRPDWALRLRCAFTGPEVAAVTGLVLPASLETDAQVVFEKGFGGFSGGFRPVAFGPDFLDDYRRQGAPVWRLGAGANMAFRRDVFQGVGLFDERLGAGAAGCSEDSEMWYRLLAAGLTCRYDPTAVVLHHHRREWSALRGQVHAYMKGHVAALLVQFARHRHWGNVRRIGLSLPAHYVKLSARTLLRRGDRRRNALLAVELGGCLSGLWEGARLGKEARE
ncbi:glycosyltransferase [Aerophototrophica crusticola]|uniref:Glycosyltransferase n=1 Tax=Aerophototrophica crusticola TaxID=1709002 RepID=A0A858R777_9PROT|nr:glycosyltransferase [Rhodospirillaceae bacterium B3]